MTFRVLIIHDGEKLNQLLTDLFRKNEFYHRKSESLLWMLSAREQLLLDVSHELRSTITRMKVVLEFILKNSSGEV